MFPRRYIFQNKVAVEHRKIDDKKRKAHCTYQRDISEPDVGICSTFTSFKYYSEGKVCQL